MSISLLKKQIVEFGLILLLIFVSGYFSLTALYGEYGLFVLFQKQAEKEHLIQIDSQLAIEIEKWSNLTKRISSSYLDLDLLDEQARRVLRVARSNEGIFFY